MTAKYIHGTESSYVNNACRCAPCRKAGARARKLRTLRVAREGRLRVDCIGSRRRLQSLIAVGWSIPALERHAGLPHWKLHNVLYRGAGVTLDRDTAELISRLYDELWDQEPPQATRYERKAATSAKTIARKNGWPTPMAWVDVDMDDWDAMPRLDAEVPDAEMFDWVKVERAAAGWLDTRELLPDERFAVAKILMQRGMNIHAAAEQAHMAAETIKKRLDEEKGERAA